MRINRVFTFNNQVLDNMFWTCASGVTIWSAATTHTGYGGIVLKGKNRLVLGTFHHQMHHRFFECNYSGLEIPCDKWAGSFNDGTPESRQQFLQK